MHHDTHDVFVLQVAGEKHWRVYDPLLELPLKNQRWSKELGEAGPAVLELTLRAGDTLYLRAAGCTTRSPPRPTRFTSPSA